MTHAERAKLRCALNLEPIWAIVLSALQTRDVDLAIECLRATGTVTPEEIEREIAERNARHDRWLRRLS